jgi:ATP-binding cassette, subfamily F, member 3
VPAVSAVAQTAAKETDEQRKQRKREEAERRSRIAPLKAGLDKLEKRLAQHQQKLGLVEQKLAAPDIYEAANKQDLRKLLDEQTQLKRQIADIEAEWLSCSEQLEQASA